MGKIHDIDWSEWNWDDGDLVNAIRVNNADLVIEGVMESIKEHPPHIFCYDGHDVALVTTIMSDDVSSLASVHVPLDAVTFLAADSHMDNVTEYDNLEGIIAGLQRLIDKARVMQETAEGSPNNGH